MDVARQSFSDSITITRDVHYTRGEVYALRGIAAATSELGDPLTALEILQQAATAQKLIPDATLSARIQLTRGKALHRLHRLAESVTALEQARKGFAQANAVIELSG